MTDQPKWRGGNAPWTEAETEKFIEMRLTGLTYKEIAPLMGKTVAAMKVHAHRIGGVGRSSASQPKGSVLKPTVQPYMTGAIKRQKYVPIWSSKAESQLREIFSGEKSLARVWTTREPGECAWPVDGEGATTRSCCHPTAPGKSYCAGHAEAMYENVPFVPGAYSFAGGKSR
jgi:hypothetical protein